MPSRSNREGRDKPPVTFRRNTTIGQDVKESLSRAGRLMGGSVGNAADKLRNRGRQIDKDVEDMS
jgi:hypothetical protein